MSLIPYRNQDAPGRRRSLNQAQIVRAALALLDEVGIDELTMRRLADKLGVKAASLYRHVRDKFELLVLLGDEISGEIPLPTASGPWRTRLAEMARNVRRGLLAHRDAARVLASTPPLGPRRLRHIEAVLRILREAGMSPHDAARAAYHCNNFVTEFAADEARITGMVAQSRGKRRAAFDEIRKHFQSLPRDQYPTVVELAGELSEDDPDSLFEFGLEIWLRGLEPLAKASTEPKAGRKPAPRR
jgi:TetR/AcrR family tetracycline transcriptional repressor